METEVDQSLHPSLKLCTFQTSQGFWVALESRFVSTFVVLKEPIELVRLPEMPSFILGVYVQGPELITAVNVADWLGFPCRTIGTHWIGLKIGAFRFALEAQQVGAVVETQDLPLLKTKVQPGLPLHRFRSLFLLQPNGEVIGHLNETQLFDALLTTHDSKSIRT
jgi:hypothetical protein